MKRYIILAVALFAAAACAKISQTDLYAPDESLKTTGEVTLCLNIEDLSTKLSSDDNGHFLFGQNDSVLVLCSDGSYVKFRLSGTGDTKRAYFKGEIPSGKTIGKYVVYPCSTAGACDGSSLKIILPSNLDYSANYACPMVGAIGTEKYFVTMKQLCSFAKIKVDGFPAGVSKVEFKDAGGKALSGEYVYNLSKLGEDGLGAKAGTEAVRFAMTTSPSAPVFSIPCPIGDYNDIQMSIFDDDDELIGSQSVSSFPVSFARGALTRIDMTSQIKVKTHMVVVDGNDSYKLKETSAGVFEAVVNVKSQSTIAINIDSELYGFASYAGAGGIGDCNNGYSALPFYNFTASHTKFYHVEKAIGEAMKLENGGNEFWVNLSAPGQVKVVYDSNYGAFGSYYLELVKATDDNLIFDEQFDLFTCGGDVAWVLQGSMYGENPLSYDGLTAATPKKANWNASGSKNVLWDYPVKVASDVVSDTYMKNRGVQDWTFARVDERPGAIQLNNGNGYDSYALTPKLSAISGTQTVNVSVVLSRYSSTSHSELYVEVLGGGEFASAHVDQTEGAGFQALSHDFAGLSGTKFTIDESYCACVPTAGNTTIYKPVSTFQFVINNATASTQIKVSAPFVSSNPPRAILYGVKVTK